MKTPDIQQRVLFVALMPAALICAALSLYFIALRYNEADAVLAARGAALARQLAPAAEYGAFSGNLDDLRRLGEAVAQEADVTAVSFYDRDHLPLAYVGTPRHQDPVDRLPNDWHGQSPDGNTLYFHAKIVHVGPPFEDPFARADVPPTTVQPIGSITVEMSRLAVIESKREIVFVTVLVSLGALLAGILFARRLSRDVAEPIVALQGTVASIQSGQLDVRVVEHPAGALRSLEHGINAMAGALQSGRDLLEQRIAEATLELRQKKEEAERTSLAKSRFLAAASHDLRQPLHALTLFTDTLRQQPTTLPQRRLLKQIDSAVFALNQQLRALLDISRLDLGDIHPHIAPTALNPIIERVIGVHLPDAQAKGLCLHHVRTQRWALTDAGLLERMLGNLLANAIRYTEAGGVVVGIRPRGDRLRLEIWDTGIGLNAEQIPLIFQEFYQIDNPERDAEKGLGLGLSIVSRLAEMLGHAVSVRSTPGRGSVFGITLPMAAAESETANEMPPRVSVAPTTATTDFGFDIDILVVGPESDERRTLCELLAGWGCRTRCLAAIAAFDDAAGGPEPSHLPDALIFGAGESAAMRRFVARYPTLPVMILLTTGDDGAPATLLPDAPCCAPLGLPLRPARLRALLQQLVKARDDGNGARDAEDALAQPMLSGQRAATEDASAAVTV